MLTKGTELVETIQIHKNLQKLVYSGHPGGRGIVKTGNLKELVEVPKLSVMSCANLYKKVK